MTRMSREFSLVLVGAGLLTAGYFLWPEPDFEKRSEEQAHNRVGSRPHTGALLFIGHASGPASISSARAPIFGGGVSRGGLGSFGGRIAGG
jgi:hypothetical protein